MKQAELGAEQRERIEAAHVLLSHILDGSARLEDVGPAAADLIHRALDGAWPAPPR